MPWINETGTWLAPVELSPEDLQDFYDYAFDCPPDATDLVLEFREEEERE